MFNLHFSKNFNWREFRSTVGSMCSNWQSFHLVYVYYGKRISFQYTLISAAVYLFLLNSNQLPVTPVIQIQAPVQTMNKFCSSRATYYQKQIRNHVVPYVNIALFNLNQQFQQYTLIYFFRLVTCTYKQFIQQSERKCYFLLNKAIV